jgi:hypothetical protein
VAQLLAQIVHRHFLPHGISNRCACDRPDEGARHGHLGGSFGDGRAVVPIPAKHPTKYRLGRSPDHDARRHAGDGTDAGSLHGSSH